MAALAGCIDAIAFVGVGSVFAGNMTGNAILLGAATLPSSDIGLQRPATSLVFFAVAVLGAAWTLRHGAAATDGGTERPGRIRVLWGIEVALLACAALTWLITAANPATPIRLLVIALLSAGLGVQSAHVTNFAPSGVSTTYVTGTLTVALMHGQKRGWRAGVQAIRSGVIVAIICGAAIGAALLWVWPAGALIWPTASLAVVAIWTRHGLTA